MDYLLLLAASLANGLMALVAWYVGELRAALVMGLISAICVILIAGGFHP